MAISVNSGWWEPFLRQTASVTLLYICLVSHTGNHTLPLQAILGPDLPLPLVTCWTEHTNRSPPSSYGLPSTYSEEQAVGKCQHKSPRSHHYSHP